MMLENEGFAVETAENGSDAVSKIKSSPAGHYAAVLMDIQMPVMDGYEATKLIRALDDPAKAGVPIVAVTANAFKEDIQKAEEAGMDGHISKPIAPEQMMGTLSKLLS